MLPAYAVVATASASASRIAANRKTIARRDLNLFDLRDIGIRM